MRFRSFARAVFATLVVLVLAPVLVGFAEAAAAQGSAVAQLDEYAVFTQLPGKIAPADMLSAHLRQQAVAALDVRDAAFEKLQTPAQVEAWQRGRREAFLSALGSFPARTPLNARVTGRAAFGDYRLEKIVFESRPGFHVTAILYLPNTSGPHPVVLHPTGHSEAAKARDLYQRASIVLAKNGIACLCYDPVGQGERRQFVDASGKARFGTTLEHQVLGLGCTLLGTSLAHTMIWDGMRAVDYLESRADIDRSRIGCVGISGGGTMTSYLGALDERIAVSAPGCYLTGFRRLLETIGPQDIEQNLFNQVGNGLDHADYVLLRAPRPILIMVATRDYFDIGGAWRLHRDAKRTYGRLGWAERVDLIEADTGHGFPMEHRVGAARWFRRWFFKSDTPVTEESFPTVEDEQLRCTPEGQVLSLPAARSLPDLNREAAEKLVQGRRDLWRDPPAALREVRRVTGIRTLEALPDVAVQTAGTLPRKGYSARKLVLKPAADLLLPALWFEPVSPARDSGLVLYVHGAGKHVDAQPGGPIEKLVLAGNRILAVDLRGMGETSRPGSGSDGRPGPFDPIIGPDWKEWTLAYLLGTSFVRMRAEDVLVCARYLSTLQAAARTRSVLVAVGDAAVPALHAAALEPQLFSAVRIEATMVSWATTIRSPLTPKQQINAVFGALRTYDLSDLIASLPEGKITLSALVQ